MKLLKFEDNWADEIDCEGLMLLDEESYQKWVAWIDSLTVFDFSIGTNEDLQYADKNELMNHIKVKDITDEEAAVISKALDIHGTCGTFGLFPMDIDCMGWYNE